MKSKKCFLFVCSLDQWESVTDPMPTNSGRWSDYEGNSKIYRQEIRRVSSPQISKRDLYKYSCLSTCDNLIAGDLYSASI
jgi:hypothetical protein